MILSAIYQPQNQFCIAVDANSDEKFWRIITELARCYPNIQTFRAKKIEWCSFEIIEAIFECVVRLSNSTVQWKYIQILSGVDAPLKTNLEMVRIFKALNGSFNTEVLPFKLSRLQGKRVENSPLPPFKSSLSAVFSREAADFMSNNEVRFTAR
ncbi:Core-2/I-Branching enzyme [Ancylostoma duodenale]|uniref:Core-2/I-Branching enzyme n=1 Tax=Ancylostoma duodenale TaxID=51022 RepID=A0A0C2C7J7_9BILA|nr:Core-2/I-Branching enzyme [Ancylostoma duodenale]